MWTFALVVCVRVSPSMPSSSYIFFSFLAGILLLALYVCAFGTDNPSPIFVVVYFCVCVGKTNYHMSPPIMIISSFLSQLKKTKKTCGTKNNGNNLKAKHLKNSFQTFSSVSVKTERNANGNVEQILTENRQTNKYLFFKHHYLELVGPHFMQWAEYLLLFCVGVSGWYHTANTYSSVVRIGREGWRLKKCTTICRI